MIKQLQFGQRKVSVYLPDDVDGRCPVTYLFGREGQLEEILNCQEPKGTFRMGIVLLEVEDWDGDLTPWKAPPVFGTEPFAGNLPSYLKFVREYVIPVVERQFPVSTNTAGRAVAGYSLGGLAAIYTFLTTDCFGAVGSFSGSLWYPGLSALTKVVLPMKDQGAAYFSVGDKEEIKSKLQFADLFDRHRRMEKLFADRFGEQNVIFEFNLGDHRHQVTMRQRKGLLALQGLLQKNILHGIV